MTHTGLHSPDHVTAAKKASQSIHASLRPMPSSGRYRAMVRGGSDLRQRLSPAFEAPHFAAAAREVDDCFDTAEGALALMGRLDRVSEEQLRQHPAHVRHRQARAALCPDCRRSWTRRADRTRASVFFYLPFEHSEDLEDENSRGSPLPRVTRC